MESETNAEIPTIEERRLLLEERKVEIELDKIRIEKTRVWTASASTVGSLLIVAATVALGIWSQYEQAKLQHSIQDRQAKAQFELKAAEIVMAADNPTTTLNKAKALQSLFPQYLSDNFAESFVPDDFGRDPEVAVATAPPEQGPVRNIKRVPPVHRTGGSISTPESSDEYLVVNARPVYQSRPRPKPYATRPVTPTPLPIDEASPDQ